MEVVPQAGPLRVTFTTTVIKLFTAAFSSPKQNSSSCTSVILVHMQSCTCNHARSDQACALKGTCTGQGGMHYFPCTLPAYIVYAIYRTCLYRIRAQIDLEAGGQSSDSLIDNVSQIEDRLEMTPIGIHTLLRMQ